MSERLTEFLFNGAGSRPQDRYDQYLDGAIWQLRHSADFDYAGTKQTPATAFRQAIGNAAARRGLKVRTQIIDRNTIVVQAYRADGSPIEATP